jgi:hypothetical protein
MRHSEDLSTQRAPPAKPATLKSSPTGNSDTLICAEQADSQARCSAAVLAPLYFEGPIHAHHLNIEQNHARLKNSGGELASNTQLAGLCLSTSRKAPHVASMHCRVRLLPAPFFPMWLTCCVHTVPHNNHPSIVAKQAAPATCLLPLFFYYTRVAGLHSFDTAFPNAQHSSPQTDACMKRGVWCGWGGGH